MTTIRKDADSNVLRTNAKSQYNAEEEFNQKMLSYYVEYGVLDDLTAVLSGGYAYVTSNDIDRYNEDEDKVSGLGDITIALRQKISNNIGAGVLMSVQLDVKIPEIYDYENPVTHQNLGDGQYDYTAKLLFGRGFSKGYAVLDLGYKYRDYNRQLDDGMYFKPSDQMMFSLSGGYNATSWLSIRGKVGYNRAVGNASVTGSLVDFAACCGVDKGYEKSVLILDTLGLEQSALSGGVSLAFTITPKIQTVISYNQDFRSFLDVRTENASLGQTYSIAFVYMM
jgi:hypothetical protein